MESQSPFILWPARCFTRVEEAGRFPMEVPLRIVSYYHATIALHLHDYAGEMWIGNTTLDLQPGDITLSPAGTESRYNLRESGHHLCIHFAPVAAEENRAMIRLPLHLRPGSHATLVRERIWRIIDYHRQGGEEGDTAAGAAASVSLQELLLWLHLHSETRSSSARSSLAEKALNRLRRIMEASLDKQVTVPELASQAGLNADYLARLFSRRYGMTIPRYLLLRRMELARHLILSSQLSMKEVGARVGIPDPQYFNKQFHRVTGQSPTAYRLQQRRPAS